MQYQNRPDHSIFDLISPAVLFLLIANILAYMYRTIDPSVIFHFGLWPLPEDGGRSPFHFWQLITQGFLHANSAHLLFNMFALWMFGIQIEQDWGTRRFAIFYFTCVIGAAIAQMIVMYGMVNPVPTVGASGGVFGVLLAFGMMYPNQPIYFIFLPIPIKAKYFVIGYGLMELFAGVTGTQAGVAHFAHLGGMAFGFILILYWRGKLPLKPEKRL